jgi:hypothetical protein
LFGSALEIAQDPFDVILLLVESIIGHSTDEVFEAIFAKSFALRVTDIAYPVGSNVKLVSGFEAKLCLGKDQFLV